jgi:hypothetical protein
MADDDQADEDPGGWAGVSSREAEGTPGEDPDAYVPARQTAYIDSKVYSHKTHKINHPPLQCVKPTRAASIRGFYFCPACGAKIKLDESEWKEERLARQVEREEAIREGARQAVDICWSTACWLVKLVRWGLGRVARAVIDRLKSKQKVTEDNGGVPPEMLAATIMMAKMMAQNRGSGTAIPAPAPEPAITPANEPAEIES